MSDCKFQVGDEVVYFVKLYGNVINIKEDECPRPIEVKLENNGIYRFTLDGKQTTLDNHSTLFFKGAHIVDGPEPDRAKFKPGMRVWNALLGWGVTSESNQGISVSFPNTCHVFLFDCKTGLRITRDDKPYPTVTQIYTEEETQAWMPKP